MQAWVYSSSMASQGDHLQGDISITIACPTSDYWLDSRIKTKMKASGNQSKQYARQWPI